MKFLIISLFALFFNNLLIGQNTGLYGKRTFVEFNTVSNMPIFSWFLSNSDGYSSSSAGNSLILKKDLFDYGFRLVIGRSGTKSAGVSFEFGYDFTNLSAPIYAEKTYIDQWGYENTTAIEIRHERFDIQTISFMPKIEFTSKGGTLPVGLNHQIGLGFTSSKIKERDYKYQLYNYYGEFSEEEEASFSKNLVNYDQSYKGITLLYAFNIRTPITKSMMINYGIRYTLNLPNNYASDYGTDQYYYPKDKFRYDIRRSRLSNVLTFNLGITYAL